MLKIFPLIHELKYIGQRIILLLNIIALIQNFDFVIKKYLKKNFFLILKFVLFSKKHVIKDCNLIAVLKCVDLKYL